MLLSALLLRHYKGFRELCYIDIVRIFPYLLHVRLELAFIHPQIFTSASYVSTKKEHLLPWRFYLIG